ncbi:MAG TPA: cyclic nucleotide-binding domain-containing protein, partial [Myxococcota bacterium]|nr:cyclic nucleotide-binding domain-containing protein [Myxococcota bacterium]
IASADPAERIAALSNAPHELRDAVRSRSRDAEPGVRAAALQRLAELSPGPALDLPAIREALADRDPRVRCAAASLLANGEGKESLDLLAASLTDRSSEVRRAAESALAARGDDAALAIEAYLRSESERTVCSALRVAAQLGAERSAELLRRELRACVHELWYWVVAHEQLPVADSLASRFLRTACLDRVCRSRRIAFFVLALIEDSSIVRNVARALQLGRARQRGDALEILSHLGERESARLLVAYFEPAPLADRIQVARRSVSVADDARDWLAEARESSSRWIRMGARAIGLPPDHQPPERQPLEDMLMERLLALKEVPLFHNLSLDQLEAVHQIAKEVEFLPGEVILREGDRGDELYLLLQGRVRIYKNHGLPDQVERPEQSAVSYFGEMAVLDDGIRTATVVAADRSLLLCLDGNSLRELLVQMPEISLEMFRVLVDRVRVAEADMRAS